MRRLASAVGFVFVLMISCSPGNPSGSGAKKSEMVGPMGAAIELEDALLEIPAGAVPPGTTITITSSTTPAPEEFESHSLNREKVVPGGKKASIYVGPLKPGRYTFFGEYNEKTAQGVLVAE